MKNLFFMLVLAVPVFARGEDKPAPAACASIGEQWSTTANGKACCKGLVSTSFYRHENPKADCGGGAPGDWGYCVKCGDGACDKEHFEDKCSCSKDCK